MLVSQILASKSTGGVIMIAPDAAVSEAAALLSEKRIGALMVGTGEGKPAGILSERDIVRELGRRGSKCLDDTVSELMTSELVHTTGEERSDQVLSKMTEGRFRHMPVFDGDKVVGLIFKLKSSHLIFLIDTLFNLLNH